MMEEQTENKSSIAFIVELFMMFGILLMVIVVITQVFMMTREKSLRAKYLTEAVIAAENTIEVTSAAAGPEEAAELAGKMEGADNVTEGENGVEFDLLSGKNTFAVKVDMDKDEVKTGTYTVNTVSVSLKDTGEEVYTLKTGTYTKEAGR